MHASLILPSAGVSKSAGPRLAVRLLNSSLATIQVLTYDQVLAKAKRALVDIEPVEPALQPAPTPDPDEYEPFADH